MRKKNDQAKSVINRLSRIEGQLKGVRKMVEEERDCVEIINQISAVREAVTMLGIELLKKDFLCKWQEKKKIDEIYLKTIFKMK